MIHWCYTARLRHKIGYTLTIRWYKILVPGTFDYSNLAVGSYSLGVSQHEVTLPILTTQRSFPIQENIVNSIGWAIFEHTQVKCQERKRRMDHLAFQIRIISRNLGMSSHKTSLNAHWSSLFSSTQILVPPDMCEEACELDEHWHCARRISNIII